MKRITVIPYVLIMVFGIVLIFILSFKGLGDMKEVAKGSDKTGGEQTQAAAFEPESFYKQTCVGCHGDQYQGVVGPALKGLTISKDEVKNIITHGKGAMPPGLVKPENADAMADWILKLK